MPITLSSIINPDNLNLAEFLSEEDAAKLGSELKQDFDTDLKSRQTWEENNTEWMKLATQYKEAKNFPWPNASNVKYPLITTASMQFAARAYPTLIVGKNPVKGRVVGKDPDGTLATTADAISKHMSYQLMEEHQDWEEEMDKLFIILPIIGVCFKKTYWDSLEQRAKSQLILPKDLVVNYWARRLEGSTRKHHVLELNKNDIYTRVEAGMFCDVELGDPHVGDDLPIKSQVMTGMVAPPTVDETTPYKIVESHTQIDLDEDGYAEPYIATFEYNSGCILRIVPRFREENIKYSEKNPKKILSISGDEYFTKYGFIPNPDGSFYDLGFGLLLGPINETVNTTINQLLDQGTMYTTGGGFLGKGARIKVGETRFQPNEWKTLNATVDDLRKAIYPLPIKEPSQVLFQLLGSLIEGGNKVASIAEIFVGKMPGQNTPATTTMETVKQGMAVFTAIYKRVYRSLDKELKKLFDLNGLYLDENIDFPVDLQASVYKHAKLTVIPTADPDVATDSEKLLKARALLELIQYGSVNPQVATKRVLEAMRVEDIQEVMKVQPPQPSPEQQKAQAEQQKMQMEAQIKQKESETDIKIKQIELQMDQMAQKFDLQMQQQESQVKLAAFTQEHAAKVRSQIEDHQLSLRTQLNDHKMALANAFDEHNQKLRHTQQAHNQKMKQKAAEQAQSQ